MSNEVPEPGDGVVIAPPTPAQETAADPTITAPLLILATDDEAACVDDLCLPQDLRS